MYQVKIGTVEGFVKFSKWVDSIDEAYEAINNAKVDGFTVETDANKIADMLVKELNELNRKKDFYGMQKAAHKLKMLSLGEIEDVMSAYVCRDGKALIDVEYYLERDGRAVVYEGGLRVSIYQGEQFNKNFDGSEGLCYE